MPIKSVKDLIVWQRAIELVKEVYTISKELPGFEVYGLVSQLRRAAVSVPANIAEGKNRKTTKEFIMFLRIAYGSSSEVETLLIIAKDAYPNISHEKAVSQVIEVQKMLATLIKKLDAKH